MKTISWNSTKEEDVIISNIVSRFLKENQDHERLDVMMSITATHLNGNPLDLEKLLSFDDFNFYHDIIGIINNINKNTGKLQNCFLPKCSK